MTWKEFKDEVERQGLKDDDELLWIDTSEDDAAQLFVAREPGGCAIA